MIYTVRGPTLGPEHGKKIHRQTGFAMDVKQGLSGLRIASKALELIDADPDGVNALTMRRLAAALGASPMALYHYFPDRDALLEGVTQLVLTEVDRPDDPALDWADDQLSWRQVIERIMRSFRVVGLRHPHTAPLLLRYAPRTPDALAFVEAGFRALGRAGFDDAAIALSYSTLCEYSFGSLITEVNRYFAGHPAVQQQGRSLDDVTMARLLPAITRVGPTLAAQNPEEQFEYGLKIFLDGFSQNHTAAGGA